MKDQGLCGQRLLCGLRCHPRSCDRLRREREQVVETFNAHAELVNAYLNTIVTMQVSHGQLLLELAEALGVTGVAPTDTLVPQ